MSWNCRVQRRGGLCFQEPGLQTLHPALRHDCSSRLLDADLQSTNIIEVFLEVVWELVIKVIIISALLV